MLQDPMDRTPRTRVAILGFGRVGTAALELMVSRPWIHVVAVVAKRATRHGEPAHASVAAAPAELRLRTDVQAALLETAPDVVIMATTSRLADVLGQVETCLSAGVRVVITTAEELAYVQPQDGPEAAALHDLVDGFHGTVVATGVNPGFVLDLWPLLLSGLAWDVERITARRAVDVSVFAPHTRRQLGIGFGRDAFEKGVADGSIAGHLGFRESLRLLCDGMGLPAERISIDTRPLLAEREYLLRDGSVRPGTSIGVSQRAVAWREGKPWIVIEMLLHAAPVADGIAMLDETHIHGRHELHARLEPGAGAILSTAAQLVNSIPTAMRADPGLYGPGQLPPSTPWLAATAPPGMPRQMLGVV